MNSGKKIINVTIKAVTWLLFAFVIFMVAFTFFTTLAVDENERDIFGYKFYIVQTDSMSLSEKNADLDVHFDAGDIIFTKSVEDKNSLQAGDIITFISMNNDSYGETITHMIREVKRNNSGALLGFVTFGTNTGVDDEKLVEPNYILGEYTGKLPTVGRFFAFVKTTPGYIICILVPFLILILYNGVNIIRLFRRYKGEQMTEIKAERERLEAERADNRRMMAELLELKAQLMKKESEVLSAKEPVSEENQTDK